MLDRAINLASMSLNQGAQGYYKQCATRRVSLSAASETKTKGYARFDYKFSLSTSTSFNMTVHRTYLVIQFFAERNFKTNVKNIFCKLPPQALKGSSLEIIMKYVSLEEVDSTNFLRCRFPEG